MLTPLHLALTQESPPHSNPSWTVPFRRDVDYVDRLASAGSGTLLIRIEKKCQLPAARVAIVGIGGIG